MNHSETSRNLLTALAPLCASALLVACQSDPELGSRPVGEEGPARTVEVAVDAAEPDASRYESRLTRSAMRERAITVLSEAALSDVALLRAHALEGYTGAPRRAETVARASIEDPNPGVRAVAATVVGRLGLKSSAPLLRPLLSDPDARVRAAAIYGMRINGLEVDPTPLSRMIMSRDPMVRRQAAFVLGELGESSAAGLLDESLQMVPVGDSAQDRLLRLEIANAMFKLGRGEAVHHIRAALYPQNREGVEAAVFAARLIGELGNRDTSRQLVEIVEQDVPETGSYERLTDPSHTYVYPPELRLAASQALAEMGFRDGRFVADTYREHADPAVRAQVARLYGVIGDGASFARLDTMLNDESESVRVSAAAAIVDAVR